MSRVFALFNQAGGVGKSTLTMNLGYSLATLKPKKTNQVLLVDLDPQASLTVFMGADPDTIAASIYDAIVPETGLPLIKEQHQMDLAPASQRLADAEQELVLADMRDVRLRDALESVQSQYDYILIDCPPSLGILSYLALVAADYILVPIQTQFKAFKGTDQLLGTLTRVKKRANPELQIAGFIPNLYDSRNSHDEIMLNAISEQLAPFGRVFSPIPKSTAFADAAMERKPLALYSTRHPAKKIIDSIAKEIAALP
jgi:chromosome partitioning protein